VIQKKICMIGAFAVGKTSLVRQFVRSIFDEKYLTSVGVRVDKKIVTVADREVMLMLWDLEGQDDYHTVKTSYFRGASGYFLVVDGSCRAGLFVALELQKLVERAIGTVPYLMLLNKSDLCDSWELRQEDFDFLSASGIIVRRTSAKTGEGVEGAFLTLAQRMLEQPPTGRHT
jgi:small GTP-binding protein